MRSLLKRICLTLLPFIFAGGLSAQESIIIMPDITTYIESGVEQRQVFNSEDISQSNTESLTDFLESQGMQILTYGAYGLEAKPSIRGFTDETVRVVIDGVCVNNAQYGTFDFTSISIENIERIEIVRGGFSEEPGDEGAVGGTIYITTKKQTIEKTFTSDSSFKTFFNFNFPLDTFSQSLNFSTPLPDDSSLKLNLKGTFAKNLFLFNSYNNILKQRENSRVIDGQAGINYLKFFGNGNSFSAGELFYIGNKECPGSENETNIGLQRDYDNNLTFNLNFPEFLKVLNFKNNLAWLYNVRFYDDNLGHTEHYISTIKYKGTIEAKPAPFYYQNAGLLLNFVDLKSTTDGNHFLFELALTQTCSFTFLDHYTVSIPLIYKLSGNNQAFIPKLGLKGSWNNFELILNAYRMVQFPNMDDLYWQDSVYHGNPDLKEESGWGGEITANLFKCVSLCAYTNYYENKIQWAGTMPQNVSSAFYFGLDKLYKKSFLEDRLLIQANAEYLYTALLNKKNPGTYKKKIMWTPDWTGSLTVTYKTDKYALNLNGSYVGKRYTSNANLYFMDPYFLLNASAQMNIQTENFIFTPYLKLSNILNTDYEAVENYPVPGISLTLGLKFGTRSH